jgi:DNA-binding XRE family transcriptional regulator
VLVLDDFLDPPSLRTAELRRASKVLDEAPNPRPLYYKSKLMAKSIPVAGICWTAVRNKCTIKCRRLVKGDDSMVGDDIVYGDRVSNDGMPALPLAGADGHYPAVAYARASLARKIIKARRAAGLSQAELARRAAIRPETLIRIEKGKTTPDTATIAKIERALEKAKERVE